MLSCFPVLIRDHRLQNIEITNVEMEVKAPVADDMDINGDDENMDNF